MVRGATIEPVSFLRAKGVLGSVPMVVVGEIVVIGSGLLLEAHPVLLGFEAAATLVLAYGISGLALAMGAIWPDFKADSAARAATGPGAVFFMVVSLVLVFVYLALLAAGVRLHLTGRPFWAGVAVVVAVAMCVAVGTLPLRRAAEMLWRSGLS